MTFLVEGASMAARPYTLSNYRRVRARVPHTCYRCGDTIARHSYCYRSMGSVFYHWDCYYIERGWI